MRMGSLYSLGLSGEHWRASTGGSSTAVDSSNIMSADTEGAALVDFGDLLKSLVSLKVLSQASNDSFL